VHVPKDIAEYDKLMVAGVSTLEPRLAAVPARLPFPPADNQGAIYENQKGVTTRYFKTVLSAIMPAVGGPQMQRLRSTLLRG
jgi:hypothetical protein